MRQLQQSPACSCPSEQLGGISAGGWVALALFIGMFIGSTVTFLIQCWRRQRELRYMSKGSTVRQSLVMMHALPAPHTPDHATQQLALPVSSAAGLPPLPHAASTKGGPNSKYFSPLNTNKGHNSVVAQLAEMRSSMHVGGSDNGGDTHSVAASDQQAPRDKNVTFANQEATPASQRGREFSQHGMRMQQHSSPGGGTWGSAAQGGPADSSPGIVLQGSVVYGAISTMGTQLPQEVSSTIFSAEGPLHEEDSSPMSTTQRARTGTGSNSSQHAGAPATPTGASAAHAGTAAAAARTTAPSPRQQAHLTASPVKAAAASSTAAPAARAQAAATEAVSPAAVRQAAGAGSAVSPDGGTSSRSKQVASPTVMTEIEDEYEETDLDDDWKALLGGVDARLKLQGARAMNARERAIAIKKLLVATGTRGVEFALNSTLQEVLHFRQLHGH